MAHFHGNSIKKEIRGHEGGREREREELRPAMKYTERRGGKRMGRKGKG